MDGFLGFSRWGRIFVVVVVLVMIIKDLVEGKVLFSWGRCFSWVCLGVRVGIRVFGVYRSFVLLGVFC